MNELISLSRSVDHRSERNLEEFSAKKVEYYFWTIENITSHIHYNYPEITEGRGTWICYEEIDISLVVD